MQHMQEQVRMLLGLRALQGLLATPHGVTSCAAAAIATASAATLPSFPISHAPSAAAEPSCSHAKHRARARPALERGQSRGAGAAKDHGPPRGDGTGGGCPFVEHSPAASIAGDAVTPTAKTVAKATAAATEISSRIE